jgi:glycosyltransferase involved in cell wall biosynthesis
VKQNRSSKKRIVLVCNTSWGMMMFRSGLMKRLIDEGFDVYVLAPKDDHSKEIEALGCYHIHTPMDNKGSNIINDLLLLKRLYSHYKKIKPDLVFHYTIKPNIFGTLAAKYADIKSIAVITGLGYTFINHGFTSKVAKILYKIALKYSQKVWFINHEDRKVFIKKKILSRENMEILPGEGVNMQKYAPRVKTIQDGKFRFVLIARLLWDKGVGELVKASAIIKEIYPHVEVELVGFVDSKNPQAISKEQVDYWVEKGWVKYMGSTDDVRDFIAEADCIVLPSYREGISKILLEAASMAKPIIASNVPGCRDIVEHGRSGYLCNVKDPHDLAQKMKKIINLSEKDRQRMGVIAREHVLHEFDEDIVLQQYLHAIDLHTYKTKSEKFILKNHS